MAFFCKNMTVMFFDIFLKFILTVYASNCISNGTKNEIKLIDFNKLHKNGTFERILNNNAILSSDLFKSTTHLDICIKQLQRNNIFLCHSILNDFKTDILKYIESLGYKNDSKLYKSFTINSNLLNKELDNFNKDLCSDLNSFCLNFFASINDVKNKFKNYKDSNNHLKNENFFNKIDENTNTNETNNEEKEIMNLYYKTLYMTIDAEQQIFIFLIKNECTSLCHIMDYYLRSLMKNNVDIKLNKMLFKHIKITNDKVLKELNVLKKVMFKNLINFLM